MADKKKTGGKKNEAPISTLVSKEKFEAAKADLAKMVEGIQGGEKVLIYECTGKIVPEGKLPSDVGCVVMNVSSIAFVAKYMRTGMPLITKRLTVDGDAIAGPKNVEVAIGTSFSDVIDFCGGFKTEPKKIIMGGPPRPGMSMRPSSMRCSSLSTTSLTVFHRS